MDLPVSNLNNPQVIGLSLSSETAKSFKNAAAYSSSIAGRLLLEIFPIRRLSRQSHRTPKEASPMKPQFIFTDSASTSWRPSEMADGVGVKGLATIDGRTMELYRFAPNTAYPDHYHEGPEFVYMLEGDATQNGQRLGPGWASAAETGTLDKDFRSGSKGCILLTVYSASRYLDP